MWSVGDEDKFFNDGKVEFDGHGGWGLRRLGLGFVL